MRFNVEKQFPLAPRQGLCAQPSSARAGSLTSRGLCRAEDDGTLHDSEAVYLKLGMPPFSRDFREGTQIPFNGQSARAIRSIFLGKFS